VLSAFFKNTTMQSLFGAQPNAS